MLEQIRRRLAGRGLGEIAIAVVKTAWHAVASLGPAARRKRSRDAEFDRMWGTDTSKLVPIRSLEFPADLADQAVRYQPSGPDTLEELLCLVAIEAGDFTFVDLGSGKGRMVLSAAALPFRRAIGVEYSEKLDRIARRNAEIFVARGGAKIDPEFHQGNAALYEPPAGPLFAYLYNPFGPKIVEACLDQLEDAMRSEERQIVLAYANPEHVESIAKRSNWNAVCEAEDIMIFELEPLE